MKLLKKPKQHDGTRSMQQVKSIVYAANSVKIKYKTDQIRCKCNKNLRILKIKNKNISKTNENIKTR